MATGSLIKVRLTYFTGAVFRHWVGVAKRAEGRHAKTHALIEQVMGFLISSDWLIGEAQNLHVYVSAEEVRHTFHRIRHEQFRKRGEFSAFLRRSEQTVGDILFRVKVNLLSTRILRQVVAGQHGTGAREDALARFVSEFDMKWRAQTYCSPAYAVRDCGHAQAVL